MIDLHTAMAAFIEAWIDAYSHKPKLTLLATVICAVALGTLINVLDKQTTLAQEAQRMKSLSYANQVKSLEDMQANLNGLIEFVENEKQQIKLSQTALDSMKLERERLKPLVESDRKVIESLFALQEAKNQASLTKERWFGVAIGVVGSLIASILWAGITYIVNRNKSQLSP